MRIEVGVDSLCEVGDNNGVKVCFLCRNISFLEPVLLPDILHVYLDFSSIVVASVK